MSWLQRREDGTDFVVKNIDFGVSSSPFSFFVVLVLLFPYLARRGLSLPAATLGLETGASEGSRADGLSRRADGGGGSAVLPASNVVDGVA